MTELIIDGKLAALKKGTSFEYVAENRLFTDSDAYSLSIELPMKDCPQNRAIYGYITRRDATVNRQPKNATLRCGTWQKSGTVSIVEVTDTSVKVQFLEGQSAANYSSVLNDTYINEISLPYPDSADATEAMCLKSAQADIATQVVTSLTELTTAVQEYLALPWLNEYSGNIQNKLSATAQAQTDTPTSQYYPYDCTKLSYQIYLLPLVQKILTAKGYTYNLDVWSQHSVWKYLLVYNALPAVWGLRNFNRPLPHWTVAELLTQIENLLGVSIEVDEANKRVTMKTVDSYIQQSIQISNVVDEYTSETNDDGVTFVGNRHGIYADCDYDEWKMLSCQDKIDGDLMDMIDETQTYSQLWTLLRRNIDYSSSEVIGGIAVSDVFARMSQKKYNSIYKASDNGFYYIRKNLAKYYQTIGSVGDGSDYVMNEEMIGIVAKVNAFGNTSEGETFELKIVPARIDDVTKANDINLYKQNQSKHIVTLNCGTIDEQYTAPTSSTISHTEDEFLALKGKPEEILIDEKEELTEFFDKLYVGFWKKEFANCIANNGTSAALSGNHNEIPVVDHYQCPADGWMAMWDSTVRSAMTDTGMTLSRKEMEASRTKVDPSHKLTVKWIGSTIPDVTSVFVIDNKRYLCERIRTQFTENGMSQLLEGEFYELA